MLARLPYSLTENIINNICKDYIANKPILEICDLYGVCTTTIYRVLRSREIPKRLPQSTSFHKQKKEVKKDKERVLQEYADRYTTDSFIKPPTLAQLMARR